MEQFNKSEIDADTTYKMQKQILNDELGDEEFLGFALLFGIGTIHACYLTGLCRNRRCT